MATSLNSWLSRHPWLASLSPCVHVLDLETWVLLVPSHVELTVHSEPFVARELLMELSESRESNEDVLEANLIYRIWGRTARRQRVVVKEAVLREIVEDFFVHSVVCTGRIVNLDEKNERIDKVNSLHLVSFPFQRRVSDKCLQLYKKCENANEASVGVCRECSKMRDERLSETVVKTENLEPLQVQVTPLLDNNNYNDNEDNEVLHSEDEHRNDEGDEKNEQGGLRRRLRRRVKRELEDEIEECNTSDLDQDDKKVKSYDSHNEDFKSDDEDEDNDDDDDDDFVPVGWDDEADEDHELKEPIGNESSTVKLEEDEELKMLSTKKTPKTLRISRTMLALQSGPVTCDECPQSKRTYSNYRQLLRHKRDFHLYNNFRCRQAKCCFSVKYPQEMVTHMQRLHPSIPTFPCKLCKQDVIVAEFGTHYASCLKANMRRNRETNTRQCHLCGQKMPTGHLRIHMLAIHEKSKPFKCDMCPFTTSYKGSLKSHRLRKHPTVEEREQQEKEREVDRASHMCDMCGKTFHSDTYLMEHRRVVHMNQQRSFECPVCHGIFLGKQNLLRHRNKEHSQDPRFNCSQCGKRFGTISAVQKHMRMHDDPQFVCSICGKALKSAGSLTDHMRIHTGEKPYKCKLCDYRCMSTNTLSLHNRFKHRNAKRSDSKKANDNNKAVEDKEELINPEHSLSP